MDKGNGQLLQSYQGHTNTDYRIRSCLGMADSVVVSASEDGQLYAWDLLEGKVIEKIPAHGEKVAGAVAFNGTKKEWASAGVDGKSSAWVRLRFKNRFLRVNRYRKRMGHARLTGSYVGNSSDQEMGSITEL